MKRRRPLRPEEIALWSEVARSVRARRAAEAPAGPPEPRATAPSAPAPALAPAPDETSHLGLDRLARDGPGGTGHEPLTRVSLAGTAGGGGLRMDARLHGRIRKGRIAPEANIDLHGMTIAEAHGALLGFLGWAQRRGHRLVLVITGKGVDRDGSGRGGALRRQVPMWLRTMPAAHLVQEVTEAHPRHGGSGALYVYLRRAG